MRAAILEEIGKLTVKDVPKPMPGHEEALVKIITSGVCHSDLHMVKKHWGLTTPPVPMGHEGIGIVEALGPVLKCIYRKEIELY
jgi:propanol-preferring alcohol dehydrogenase